MVALDPLSLYNSARDTTNHEDYPLDDEADLEFNNLPPFPKELPAAPLLRISLRRLISGDSDEIERFWSACCQLGFFYLDLRGGCSVPLRGPGPSEEEALSGNARKEDIETNEGVREPSEKEVELDGNKLLQCADELFALGKKVFGLPVEEKVKYNFNDRGSYFGYKGYGEGVIDAQGTRDRTEFYNVSKDDILGVTSRLPAPDVLNAHRELLGQYIKQSHAIVTLLLQLLNTRLALPSNKLQSLHRLRAVSGDQIRWINAPPQPANDRRAALGEHTDFGSVSVLFNQLGGLQVLPPGSDTWCYVKPLRGHAIVNLGDAMVKFTRGILRSNIHRVVNPPGEQADFTRMSLVYFSRPEDDVILKALDGSELIDEKIRSMVNFREEEEITSKEWIMRRVQGRRPGADWEKSKGTEKTIYI